MNEFIEKLIGRLEEEYKLAVEDAERYEKGNSNHFKYYKARGYVTAMEVVIEIVNQLAEEYKGKYVSKDEVGYMLDTIKMRGYETWMDYYHKALKGLCELSGGEYNGGWIPCSERLPEDREEKLVYLSSGRTTIAKYNEHRLPFSDCPIGWGYDSSNGYIDFESETVIAWQPLPAPYE
jgi:predicted DNA-binding protein